MGLFSSDPELFTDGAIYSQIREIIAGAEETLTIVSPYIDPTGDFVRQMLSAADRRVDVTVLFRRDRLSEYKSKDWFRDLADAKVTLGTIERLHSKVYVNEKAALLTSMNFYSSSGENSFEIGMLVESGHSITKKLEEYLEFLAGHTEYISAGASVARRTSSSRPRRSEPSAPSEGHCLRCGTGIPLNPARPYCATHYESWAKYKDAAYEERHCHRCGNQHPTSMRKPVCPKCYAQRPAA